MTLTNNIPHNEPTRAGKYYAFELETNLEGGATIEVSTSTGRVIYIFSSSSKIEDNERTILARSNFTTLTLKNATVTQDVTSTEVG
jgi:hypothetical protein